MTQSGAPSGSAVIPVSNAPNGVGGPRIVVDSSARGPTLEIARNEFVLRLPVSMARVLQDSMPGFAPVPRARFDSAVISYVDHGSLDNAPENAADINPVRPAPLSVVIGDFDGDSTADVAMLGSAGDTVVTVFLLSPHSRDASPRLLYIDRPRADPTPGEKSSTYLELVRPGKITAFDEDAGEPPSFHLLTDAVSIVYFEQAGEVAYVDRGVVRRIITSD